MLLTMLKNKFKEKDALKKVDSPLGYQYMKWVKYNLNNIGGWPMDTSDNTSKLRFRMRHYLMIATNIALVSQLIYILNNYSKYSLFIMGQTYITFMLNAVGSSRSILHCVDKYRRILKYFINDIHLYHHKHLSKYALQTHIMVHKLSHYYTLYLLFLVGSGMMLFNLTPLYNNISSGAFNNPRPENVTFEHAVYFALPFDCFTDIRGYIPIVILNWHFSYNTSTIVCNFDLLISLMILHLWGHIKILINDLQSIPEPQTNRLIYTAEENCKVFIRLQECIKKHNSIINFAAEMSNTYDVVIAIYYLFFQVTCCMLLLQCSTLELRAITRYGPLTVIIFQQLIQISVIFELLGNVSDKVPDAVYNIPWECMNRSNRKMVQLLLMKSQTPIQFRVLNTLNIGVSTMVSILKSSISYFVMLRTIDSN